MRIATPAVAALALTSFLTSAAPVAAQPERSSKPVKKTAKPKPAAPPTTDDADALVEEAGRAYESGHLPEALDAFRRAYAQRPDNKLLYAMAKIEVELGDCAAALEHLRQFLASNPGRKAAAAASSEGAACKPSSVAATTPAAAMTSEPSPAEPTAGRAGAEPVKPSDSSGAPRVTEPPVVDTAAPVLRKETWSGSPPVRTEHRPWYTDILGDTLIVGGVAGLATGGAFWTLSYRDRNAKVHDVVEHSALVDRSEDRALVAYIAGGVGGALLIGGLVRYATRDSERRVEVSAAPSAHGGMTFALSGRF